MAGRMVLVDEDQALEALARHAAMLEAMSAELRAHAPGCQVAADAALMAVLSLVGVARLLSPDPEAVGDGADEALRRWST